MNIRTCQSCEGNGYYYDKDLGELTGFCPTCNGEGFTESEFVRTYDSFHVELTVKVASDAYFSEDIRRKVELLGWGHDEYPVQSDYLLQLITNYLDRHRLDGVSVQSISVGKKITYVNSIDVEPNQPTLF